MKGGHWEQPGVTYPSAVSVDRAFQKDCATLMARGTNPTIATHDPNAIRFVKQLALKHRVDVGSFEFEMLYGVRPGMAQHLSGDGFSVRIYVPYGAQWYEYTLGCLRKLFVGIVRRPSSPRRWTLRRETFAE